MSKLSRSLMARIAEMHGVVTADDLRRDGVGQSAIRALVGSGALVRMHRGVYRVGTAPMTFEARCAAACAADPEALISGLAGANLWEFRHVPRVELPEVLVGHSRTPLARGVTLRRTNMLGIQDVVSRRDGIRVASPPRVWFDCAVHLDDERFEKLSEWVLDRHTTVPTLWRTVRRLTANGRPGLARVHRVMSRRQDWQRPADSGLEVDVHNELARRGVGPLVRQHPIELPSGVTIHPDVVVREVKWAVEVDHVTWHGGRLDAQRDKARDRQARRIGWQVDRVTDHELREAFAETMDELVELFELRVEQVAATARTPDHLV